MSKIIGNGFLATLLLSSVILPTAAWSKLAANGKSLNGVSLNRLAANGVSLNKLGANGVTVNGVEYASGSVEDVVSIALPDGTTYTKVAAD